LGGLQPWHWVIVIAVFVLLFGAKKLPDAARSLGKSMRIFKSEIKEMQSDSKPEASAPPATPIASERVDRCSTGMVQQHCCIGIVAGPAAGYQLDDNSQLVFPSAHELGARKETVNGIGVAPDWFAPLTPADLSAGRDPGVARALSLLRR